MKHIDYKQLIRIGLFPFVLFVYDRLVNMRFDLYKVFPWLDIPMHLLGGASIAVSATLFLRYLQNHSLCGQMRKWIFHLWNMGLVSLAAILWEFNEFLSDYFFHGSMQPSLADTMGDLFLGLLGGFVASICMVHCTGRNFEKEK